MALLVANLFAPEVIEMHGCRRSRGGGETGNEGYTMLRYTERNLPGSTLSSYGPSGPKMYFPE